MNQKLIKTSTPSNSTLTMKNPMIGFDQILHNSSSQPMPTDSPFNRKDLQSRSNSLRSINSKKASHEKLAFLLETNSSSTKRTSFFNKHTDSDSKILDKELQSGQRYCIGTKILNSEKKIHPKIRLNLDKANQSMGLLIQDAHNKETQRPRKYKKTHKLSTGGKDAMLKSLHLSHNVSYSPDNSIFINGLASTTHHGQRRPSGSPKISLLNTVQSQFTDFVCPSPNKKTGKAKKMACFSESVSLEPSQKAYLNHNASSQNWKQCHRKMGSNSNICGSSSIIRKSLNKIEDLKSVIPQVNTSHLKVLGLQNTLRSSSRETVKKGIDISSYLNTLRVNFDSVIGSYGSQIADAQANQELLKKIKQEYEAVIVDLIGEKERQNDNQALLEENARLKAEISALKGEQEKLRESVKNTQEVRLSSPCQSGMPTEKRVPSLKFVDSPPLTKNGKRGGKFERENEKLKQILMRQQGTISTLRKKETKMLRLICAIKKRNVDVEKIYNEDVKGKNECMIPDEVIPTLDKLEVSGRTENELQEDHTQRLEDKEESIMQGSEDESEYDCIDLKPTNNLQVAKGNLNPMLKDKLKLDFRALKKTGEEKNNLNNQASGEPLGFHEEFMSKFEEFSLSWRQESMLQKNP